ncbi:MAG: cupin domain-containing protein [Verrucomicrobia bacterium]|nr:cupin domain-containing protein [Verrucomicrobiota bacterium]
MPSPDLSLAHLFSSPANAPVLLEQRGVKIRLLVSAEATDGAWSLLDYQAPAGAPGPHPHYHARTTETFYVVSGRLHFDIDGHQRTLGSGELVRVAPGIRHHFSIPKEVPAHFLILFCPGGLEGYFRELDAIVSNAPAYPLPDMTPVIDLGRRYDSFAG